MDISVANDDYGSFGVFSRGSWRLRSGILPRPCVRRQLRILCTCAWTCMGRYVCKYRLAGLM